MLKYLDATDPVAEDDWEALDGLEGGLMRNVGNLERKPILEVSADQELVTPASVLAKMRIQPGEKFMPIYYQGIIHLTPLISPEEARGSMPGLDKLVDSLGDEE